MNNLRRYGFVLLVAALVASILSSSPAAAQDELQPNKPVDAGEVPVPDGELAPEPVVETAVRASAAEELVVPVDLPSEESKRPGWKAGVVSGRAGEVRAEKVAGSPVAVGLASADLRRGSSVDVNVLSEGFASQLSPFSDFYEFAGNPSNDVLFNLDGVRNPWSSVQRAGDLTLDEAMRAGASITDWELAQIYRNNWSHVQFFENGVPVPSPFG